MKFGSIVFCLLIVSCNRPNACFELEFQEPLITGTPIQLVNCTEHTNSIDWRINDGPVLDQSDSIVFYSNGIHSITQYAYNDRRCDKQTKLIKVYNYGLCNIELDDQNVFDTSNTSNIRSMLYLNGEFLAENNQEGFLGAFTPIANGKGLLPNDTNHLSLLVVYKKRNASGNPYFKDSIEFNSHNWIVPDIVEKSEGVVLSAETDLQFRLRFERCLTL